MSWESKFYTTPGGKRPVFEYLEAAGLSEGEEDKLDARLEFLEEHGPLAGQNVPRGYAQLKGKFRDISEIRIPGNHNVRIFYFIDPKKQVVLLSGVSKGGIGDKKMKRHYARALRYRNDWLTRCI